MTLWEKDQRKFIDYKNYLKLPQSQEIIRFELIVENEKLAQN